MNFRKIFHGQFPGAPRGEYLAVLDKSETESDNDLSPTGGGAGGVRIYSYVKPEYRKKATTPLKITVAKKSTKESFEVGLGKRVLLKSIIELRENFAMDDFNRTRAIPELQDLLRCVRSFRLAKFIGSTVNRENFDDRYV